MLTIDDRVCQCISAMTFNPLSANPTKWSITLKQFVGKLTNCLSMSEFFMGLTLKVLTNNHTKKEYRTSSELHYSFETKMLRANV